MGDQEKAAVEKSVLGVLSDLAEKVGTLAASATTLDKNVVRLDCNVSALDAEVKRHNVRMQVDKAERAAERQADATIREAEREAYRRERRLFSDRCDRRHAKISEVLKKLGAKDSDIEVKLEQTGKISIIETAKELGKQELITDWQARAIRLGKLLSWTVGITTGVLAIMGGLYALLTK